MRIWSNCFVSELHSNVQVYGDIMEGSSTENSLMEPTNPYACSKAAAEFVCRAYRKSYDIPVIITRGNNVYGPRQYPEKAIPKFILRLLRGLPCCIHGSGVAMRNYMHVEDVARAFDTILHYGKDNERYIGLFGRNRVHTLSVVTTLVQTSRFPCLVLHLKL